MTPRHPSRGAPSALPRGQAPPDRPCYTLGVQIRELKIPDSYEITPKQFADDRGVFLEWYRFDRLEEAVGHRLDLAQGNTSVSKRGVVRGIHFADIPPRYSNSFDQGRRWTTSTSSALAS